MPRRASLKLQANAVARVRRFGVAGHPAPRERRVYHSKLGARQVQRWPAGDSLQGFPVGHRSNTPQSFFGVIARRDTPPTIVVVLPHFDRFDIVAFHGLAKRCHRSVARHVRFDLLGSVGHCDAKFKHV
jgi:hypothetical protein